MTSYATTAEGDTYFAEVLDAGAWTNATTSDKTKALAMATRAIDRLNFIGMKAATTQTLQFPRKDDTSVPSAVKDACCELARAFLDGVDDEMEVASLRAVKRELGDAVLISFPMPLPNVCAGVPSIRAWNLLRPWLRNPEEIDVSRAT